jgi:hypothetical protein
VKLECTQAGREESLVASATGGHPRPADFHLPEPHKASAGALDPFISSV